MSAIFGIICKKGCAIENSQVNAMQAALQHRATHGAGIYHSGNVMLGNNKLITNIYQKTEEQPCIDKDFVITADARIDNRDEMIKRLGINGGALNIHDSSIILEAYKKWGAHCTDFLTGEFAFVIWNNQSQTLFAATDHIGFRSFYYYHTPNVFIFSSEIKGILASKPSPHTFNKEIIAEYFTQNYSGATFDKDVRALKGASQLLMDSSFKLGSHVYWTLQQRGKYRFKKNEEWAECLNQLLTQSVQNRLNTDLPVGISLSGGLDSSYVAAIAANILYKKNKPLYAFSSVLDESHNGPETDERHFIELMGKRYPNIEQTYIHPPLNVGPLTDLENIFETIEVMGYNFLYMDKAICAGAKTKNINVLLTGFGGDFTISNNGNYMVYQMLLNRQFNKVLPYFFKMKKTRNLSFVRAFKRMILDYSVLSKLYAPLVDKLKKTTHYPVSKELNNLINTKPHFGTNAHDRKRLQTTIGKGIIGGLLYNSSKKMGASFGMDITAPILDKNISEFFFDVPPEQFILNGQPRSLMRRAMDGIVPVEIQQRNDKSPFSPGFAKRFRGGEDYKYYLLKTDKFKNARKYVDENKLFDNINQLSSSIEDKHSVFRETILSLKLIVFLNWLEEKKSFEI